jgi:hypothetical protein
MARVCDIKQTLAQVASVVFAETPVLFAYLYGSFVKGPVHPFSDLDIAIWAEGLDRNACLHLELSLALRIDEELGHRVQSDVRVVNHLPLVVKGNVLTEGELIYSRAEEQRIEFETQVRGAYFDFLPAMLQFRNAFKNKLLADRVNGLNR